jgi:hypothetical protein
MIRALKHFAGRVKGITLLAAVVLLLTSGCVSTKPLPYHFAQPVPPPSNGPELAVAPTKNARPAKDNMDKVLQLPDCLDNVLVKELEGAGVFGQVHLSTNGIAADQYLLEPSLVDLRWEVPDYDRKVATVFAVSLLTGGIGGIGYGATGTDVLGHAKLHVKLTDMQKRQVVLEREYQATAKDNRSKLNCDTPSTYREMAASALKQIIEDLKQDLRNLRMGGEKSASTKVNT